MLGYHGLVFVAGGLQGLLPLCPAEPMSAGSRMDSLLTKADPIRNAANPCDI